MTTYDYPGDTNFPNDVDAATPIADPHSERLVESPTADTPVSPDSASDPGWERQADQFAADRHQRSESQTSAETSLFAGAELEEFRSEWNNVQAGFVDDPKRCVEQADGLVSSVVQQLSIGFADARSRLEQQWSRGEDASTEDLRVALKRYREFFDRLLAV
jgi:hypothetical protein